LEIENMQMNKPGAMGYLWETWSIEFEAPCYNLFLLYKHVFPGMLTKLEEKCRLTFQAKFME
jgi:hypothetical protein